MKKKVLILFIVVLAALLCFAACINDSTVDGEVGVKSIEVIKGTVTTQFKVGDTPDFSGIKVKVVFEDNTTKEIGYTDVTVSELDTSTAGKKTVTVTYNGVSVNFEVNVVEEEVAPTVTSIKIVPGTLNLDYYIGQIPDVSTLQVEATYSNGTTSALKVEEYTFTTIDTSTSGEKTFTVTYTANTELTDSVKITVAPISSITVITGSVKNKLNVGETLDTSKIQVAVEYENGKGEVVEVYNLTVGTVDTTTYGKKSLSITYKGITIEYPVEVVGMVSLTVNKGSYPETVKIGSTVDASGITAVVKYSDGVEKPLTASDLKLGTVSTAAVGKQNLAVSYENSETHEKVETTVEINVIGVKTLTVVDDTVSKEILKGNTLDLSDIMVSVEYTDGSTDSVVFDELTFGNFDTNVAGDKTINITYLDKTIDYSIKVCEITSLVIEGVAESVPSGKPIDITNMKVYGVYNDSKQTKTPEPLNVADYTTNVEKLNGEQLNSTAARTLTVDYNGVEGTWTVYTTAPELIEIEISNFDTEVLLNGEYDKNSVTVTATYGNGTEKTIYASNLTIEIATNVAGETTLKVTYEGKTATETVKVCTIRKIVIKGVSNHLPAGEELDLSTIEIWGVYDNADEDEILLTAGTYTSNKADIDANKDENAAMTLQVTYTDGVWGELKGTFNISAQEPILESIKITKWDKEVFINGVYNKGNVVVTAYYGNGTSKEVTGFTVEDVTTTVGGNTTLTVTYEGKTATETVKVCKITSLVIDGVAESVPSGKPINIDNIKVYGVYNDSKNTRTPEPLNKADYTTNIGELNANVNGMESRVLVVTYTNGAEGTLEITVTAPEMTGITITNWDKTIGLGGVYNKDSVVIAAILGNGTTGQITVPGTVSISDVVTSVSGEVEFTVTYTTEAGATYTTTAKVNVLSISRLEVSGVPSVVNKGEALDLSKIKVTAIFSDGSSRVVSVSDTLVSTPDTSAAGDKTFTVKYLGFEQPVSYHVRAITSVKILSGSVNTALRAGYEVDVSGLILDITYSNGDREQKKASELTGVTYTGTGKGSTKFTVKFKYIDNEEFSDSVSLTQITVTKISALNNTIPALVMQGTTLDFSSMSLSVYYDNGEVYLVPLPLPKPGELQAKEGYLTVDYKGVDTSKPGAQAISFIYNDGVSVNHAYDALLGAGAINAAQYEVLKYNFDTSVPFTVRGIKTVEIVAGSVYDKIYVGKTVDTSGISVKVTYDDGTYIYVKRNNTALTVYDSKDDIDTSLGDNEESKVVKLWVEFSGVRGSMDITVEKMPETSGVIVGVLLPDTIVARESYKKNFLDYSTDRPSSPYYVGDDNLFYFYLDVIELDKNDDVVEKDGKTNPTAGKVYLVEGNTETELTGDKLTYYVKVDYSKNSYDFTENAIGKTFRLEIRPEGTPETTSLKKSHTVTVVDGYNIYEAWELNVMTNVHHDITQKCFGTDGMIYQDEVVDKFLLGKGVTRPATLASIVLHGNLDVKPSDIPPEYSYVDEKGVNQGLYNQLGVFHRELTTEQKEFKIYGNYFSVYSYSLPCVVPNNVANNTKDGGFSSSALFKSTLSSGACSYIRGKQTKEAFSEFVVTIQDISTRDNDPNSNDQTASERHMRGLSCYKVGEMRVDMTAVNVEAFMTSVVCENMGSTLNLNKVKLYNAWQTHLFLWNQNEIQNTKEGEKVETWGYIPNLTVNINSSEITKCGGPVILAQAPNVNEPYNRTCGVEVHVDEKLVSADDKKSDIWTYVTGQEAWFVAVGQTQIAAQIRAMSTTIGNGCGFTSKGHIQGVETVNMIMVAMGNNGTALEGTTSNVLYSREGEEIMQSHHPDNTKTFQVERDKTINDMITQNSAYVALKVAPLFETDTGGLGYIDATMKCNYLNDRLYTGDYITLYYTSLGANIMMDYYTPAPENANP